jgi:hypothetical protein
MHTKRTGEENNGHSETSITSALQEIENSYAFSSLASARVSVGMLIEATNVGLFHCRGYSSREKNGGTFGLNFSTEQ